MPYIPHTDSERSEMFRTIGVDSIDALFETIPPEDRFDGLLDIPAGLTELELDREFRKLASTNHPAIEHLHFLGGGCYDHFIPALVDHLASDPRFVTAYTPYQPEASQGSLQAFFEYQTLVARLCGMELSNASHYDGATACVEAVLMAHSATRRSKIVVPESLHPEYRQVLETYLANLPVRIETFPTPEAGIDPNALKAVLDDDTAAILVPQPNFFGSLEPVREIGEAIHRAGGLLIVCADPISLGLLTRPGDLGADIVVAEGQSLGIPMSYGGPFLGIMTCRESLIRRIPGRLVGRTRDRRGKTCWVLTMQTREQHIRREKATSNICSNQGLMALRAAVYLAALGPQGLKEVAELSVRNAHYLAQRLTEKTALTLAWPDRPFFKEFVVRTPAGIEAKELCRQLELKEIYAGIPLSRFGMDERLLMLAVTEKRTREEMDRFVKEIADL